MRLRFALGMAVALLVPSAAAFAYPSLNASTGLIGVPNATIAPSGSFTGAADVLFFNDAVLNARAIVGFSPRFEGGAAVVLGNDTGLAVNGKYNLATDIGGFAASLGATYITSDNSGSGWQAYLVGTRTLSRMSPSGTTLNGTLGVTFTDMEDLSAVRPFLGAQLQLSPKTEIGAEFEFEAGDFDESISSIYLRQNMGRWSGQLGFTNANGFVGTRDHDFFLGVAYAFPGGK